LASLTAMTSDALAVRDSRSLVTSRGEKGGTRRWDQVKSIELQSMNRNAWEGLAFGERKKRWPITSRRRCNWWRKPRGSCRRRRVSSAPYLGETIDLPLELVRSRAREPRYPCTISRCSILRIASRSMISGARLPRIATPFLRHLTSHGRVCVRRVWICIDMWHLWTITPFGACIIGVLRVVRSLAEIAISSP